MPCTRNSSSSRSRLGGRRTGGISQRRKAARARNSQTRSKPAPAELSGNNAEIDRLCIQKIYRVSPELMFDPVGEPGWADQVQRRCPMQTTPEQPIEAGKMVHMRMRYKSMRSEEH